MNTTQTSTVPASPGAVDPKSSMNKGIAVGAAGALAVAAVIGGASWFAFSRGESVEQTNRMGSPTTVIGDASTLPPAQLTPPVAATPGTPAPQLAAPAQPVMPPPVYQPSPPPIAQVAPVAPATAPRVAATPRPAMHAAVGRSGVVQAVHEVNEKGDANGVGAAVGGVLGGLLGHQVGGGHGRTALTVAGAVGGGLAGHEVQKRMNGTKVWNVTVQFDDGSTQTLRETSAGQWRAGDRVRVRNGVISQDNA